MNSQKIKELRQRCLELVVRCVQCAQVWLVMNLRLGDTYICKDCSHRFVVDKRSIIARRTPMRMAGVR